MRDPLIHPNLKRLFAFLLLAGIPFDASPNPATSDCAGHASEPHEISGIDVDGGVLYLVDDEVTGRVFRYPLRGVDASRPFRMKWPLGFLTEDPHMGADADDLEAVRYLPGYGPIALSECHRTFYGPSGPVLQLPEIHQEFANRGLEGFDIKLRDDRFWFVVLHEGGYPEREDVLHHDPNSDAWKTWINPYIFTFIFNPRTGTPSTPAFAAPVSLNLASLHAQYYDPEYRTAAEPGAQRFRAPAVLWQEMSDTREPVLLVLLSSENQPPEPSDVPSNSPPIPPVRYRYKLLQRFSLSGSPIGKPIDIDEYPSVIAAGHSYPNAPNWEGMAWFEKGKSVILVNDKPPDTPVAVVIELPEDYR